MARQTITLISHSICGRRRGEDDDLSPAASAIVSAEEFWTTFRYTNNFSVMRGDTQMINSKSKFSRRFPKCFMDSVASDTKSTRKLQKNKKPRSHTYATVTSISAPDSENTGDLEMMDDPNGVKVAAEVKVFPRNREPVSDKAINSSSATFSDASISAGAKTYISSAEANGPPTTTISSDSNTTGAAFGTGVRTSCGIYSTSTAPKDASATGAADLPGERQYKCSFGHSKRAMIFGGSVPALDGGTDKKSSKKSHLRRWFNKKNPETVKARRISKARYYANLVAIEAARMASVRRLARKAARAGAFAAAAYAYVTAEELSPRASHGSIAAIISMACKDVANTSTVRMVKNRDYVRLHRLFYYHYKFRGPDYYKPLDPICTVENGSKGEFVVHCRMDGPGDTSGRFEVPGKDSPLILFLKKFSVESKVKVEGCLNLNQPDGYNYRSSEVVVINSRDIVNNSKDVYSKPGVTAKVNDVHCSFQEDWRNSSPEIDGSNRDLYLHRQHYTPARIQNDRGEICMKSNPQTMVGRFLNEDSRGSLDAASNTELTLDLVDVTSVLQSEPLKSELFCKDVQNGTSEVDQQDQLLTPKSSLKKFSESRIACNESGEVSINETGRTGRDITLESCPEDKGFAFATGPEQTGQNAAAGTRSTANLGSEALPIT